HDCQGFLRLQGRENFRRPSPPPAGSWCPEFPRDVGFIVIWTEFGNHLFTTRALTRQKQLRKPSTTALPEIFPAPEPQKSLTVMGAVACSYPAIKRILPVIHHRSPKGRGGG